MRQFYLSYEKVQSVTGKLTWTHYCELLTISDPDKRSFYENVAFGVYKISAFQETVGEYDQDTGVLIFSAKDAYGKTVSAEARKRDDYIVVTIIDWDYEDYLPNGTELVFYKRG